MPDNYGDVYLCDLFNMSYTELAKQPVWWVKKMKTWQEAKRAAENERAERDRRKAKLKHH